MGFNHVSEEEKEGHFFFPKSTELEEIRKYFQTVAALLMAQKRVWSSGHGTVCYPDHTLGGSL